MNATIIRKAIPSDITAVTELIQANTDQLEPRTREELSRAIDSLWVAEHTGKIVGCALLDVYSERIAEIRSVAVAKDYRQQGIGKQLVHAAAAEGVKRNIKEIFALTSSTDIFQSLGFANSTRSKYAMFLKKDIFKSTS